MISERALLVLIALAFAAPATAQDTVTSFADLSKVVKRGNVVFVQNEKGERVKGKITELSDASLQIMTGGVLGRTYTFQAEQVTRVSKIDSRLNGFLIGAIAGAVPGLILGHGFNQYCKNESPDYCPAAYPLFGGLLGLVGGGIGYAIDGAIDGQTLIFRRPGLSVSVRF
ncbi:MAG TPA: hypothetical protein VJ691_00350 [Vicinamibacterales bacterium]|nr:hypothetical protein [Vicinamibacterales bacterium]